jgi:dTDP-4-amino-4,6-dideoxygalactose transaminase
MSKLRHQLPVHSPIPPGALLAAAWRGTRRRARGLLAAELAARYPAEKVVLVGSGTQALQLALRACGAEEVALPAFTCYDVASAAIGAGARVRLYDVDPVTLSPDAASLESALRQGVRVVVVAPLYGVPVRWGEIEALAASYGARVIEDAAQGSGASWRGTPLGGLGTISVISFGRGKGWTGGSGGAVLLRGSATLLPERVAAAGGGLRAWTGAAAQWAVGRPAIYVLPVSLPGLGLGETRYHAPAVPAGMPAAAAALALATRAASDAEAESRRENARLLLEALSGSPAAGTIHPPAGSVAGYLRLPLRLPHGLDSFASPERALRLGVGRSYPTTLAELAPLQGSLVGVSALPGAQQLARELVTLPTHSRLRAWERAELLRSIAAIPALPAGAAPAPLRKGLER